MMDVIHSMTWYRSRSPASIFARFCAIMIVVAWTLVPAICGGEFKPEHANAQVAGHDHGTVDARAAARVHPQHEDLSSCCRSLADAKFLAAAPEESSPSKATPVVTIDVANVATEWSALRSVPALAPRGPPRIRSSRYISYNPLAPPARTV